MPEKWVDNVLSHYRVDGVSQSRQGVARRLTAEALLLIELALRLSRALSIPMGKAIVLASSIHRSEHATVQVEQGITLAVDLDILRGHLNQRLAEAVEVAPIPRRGRPPRDLPKA
ncbi:MAG TPA: hypothetical protein VF042_06335 [Gemmatimonadaceae bacterium]